jgi:large subunit GTPase 1
VFPNVATSKAELLLAGVLPIDQMRDHVGAMSLLSRRIPRSIIEAAYRIVLPVSQDGSADDSPFYRDILQAYAVRRGYMTKFAANESRAARGILKDYVSGRLLYVTAPPGASAEDVAAARAQAPLNKDVVLLLPSEQRMMERLAKGDQLQPTNAKLMLDDGSAGIALADDLVVERSGAAIKGNGAQPKMFRCVQVAL